MDHLASGVTFFTLLQDDYRADDCLTYISWSPCSPFPRIFLTLPHNSFLWQCVTFQPSTFTPYENGWWSEFRAEHFDRNIFLFFFCSTGSLSWTRAMIHVLENVAWSGKLCKVSGQTVAVLTPLCPQVRKKYLKQQQQSFTKGGRPCQRLGHVLGDDVWHVFLCVYIYTHIVHELKARTAAEKLQMCYRNCYVHG